jgi:hypothetical protein
MVKGERNVDAFLSKIFLAHGHPVIADSDLADLYETTTSALNQQVKRNMERFNDLFAFRLTRDEWADLKSQTVTAKKGWGGRTNPPMVFTQEGMLMAATVVRSPRATETVKLMVHVFRTVFPQFFSGSAQMETKSATSNKQTQLLDTIGNIIRDIGKVGIDPASDATIASELQKLPKAASDYVQAKMDGPTVQNEETRAQIRKLDAESEKLRADAYKSRMEGLRAAVEAYTMLESRDASPVIEMMNSMTGYSKAGPMIDITPSGPDSKS